MVYPTTCDLPLQGLYIVSAQGGEEIPHDRVSPSFRRLQKNVHFASA